MAASRKRTDLMFVIPEDTAVVPFIMGAPERNADIEPFLKELLSDPELIKLPLGKFIQKPFASWISKKRAPKVTPRYDAIGGSPLAANTRRQCMALERMLGAKVTYVFRYLEPRADTVFKELKEEGFRRIVALSLYPQYSHTTVRTSLVEMREAAAAHDLKLMEVDSYPTNYHYIRSLVYRWRETIAIPDLNTDDLHVLFTAHGIPMSIVEDGDPYPLQVRQTMDAVVKEAENIKHYSLAFQSKMGPGRWTEPYLDGEIERLARAGVKNLVLFPLSFVSEHLETIYDLDLVAKDHAIDLGIESVLRVPAVGEQGDFIEALASMAVEVAGEEATQ